MPIPAARQLPAHCFSISSHEYGDDMAGQILAGIRVLELGQLIAGPFAAKTLADFGAQVIKIEPPGQGDPLRKWRLLHEGTSVWWEAQSRNKQSVCVDLRQPEGQDLARQLAAQADVLIENFRPGTMEKWGLSWEALHALNPRLIMLRISGYGQTGPKAQEPGFAAIGEAMAGLRYLNGEPGRAPVRAGLSLGDTIAGLHGAMGVLLALYQRDARGGQGQVIDAALYESIFNLSESLLPEYSVFGAVRRAGRRRAAGHRPVQRLSVPRRLRAHRRQRRRHLPAPHAAHRAHRPGRRPRARAQRRPRAPRPRAGCRHRRLDRPARHRQRARGHARAAGVPAGRIYSVADIAQDPHYQARGAIARLRAASGIDVDMPAVFPCLSDNPGAIRERAPLLGEHTDAVLEEAGLDDAARAGLRARGVIA
ncbi:conserved hypothetical protein [Bordetella bronchiseptica MO211]|nr:conserved hypothetical protein [Bordetella bronchiseptica MO211]